MTNNKVLLERVKQILYSYGISDNFLITIDLSHRKTGNYFIQTHRLFSDKKFINTGVNDEHNNFYVIGYMDGFYVLSCEMLRKIQTKMEIIPTRDGLSKGFLLSEKQIQNYSITKINIRP